MDRRSHNLLFTSLIVVVTTIVATGGFLLLSTSPDSERVAIPDTPLEGLADRDDASLGLTTGADPTAADAAEPAGRPVLQVTDGSGAVAVPSGVPAAAGAAAVTPAPAPGSTAPGSSAPSAPPSTVPVVPSSTTVPATNAPLTTQPTPSTTSATVTMGTVPPGQEWLSPVEWEIVRLTNELRTNPNGPLKREGAVIDCGGRIPIDPASGQYQPVAALTVDRVASVDVARPWAAQLTSDLLHRPQAGIVALQGAGVAVMTAGENIAYHNFPEKAFQHFVGWRESDGHFCNMMDPGFSHIGIGEHTRADGFSFATQNFFSLQPAG